MFCAETKTEFLRGAGDVGPGRRWGVGGGGGCI